MLKGSGTARAFFMRETLFEDFSDPLKNSDIEQRRRGEDRAGAARSLTPVMSTQAPKDFQ
jgi:hypothetical protein